MTDPIIRKNELLKNLIKKVLNQDQFQYECAMWLLEPECWNEIRVKFYPTTPPEWSEYEAMSEIQKVKLEQEFFRQSSIASYLKAKGAIYAWNKGLYDYLTEMKKYIPDDAKHLNLNMGIDKKIFEFKKWLQAFAGQLFTIKKEEVKQDLTKEAVHIADIFSGEVLR